MSQTIQRMLSIVLCALLLFGVVPITAVCAEEDPTSGVCGENLTWAFDADSATLTVRGTGAMTAYSYSDYNGSNVTTAPWRPYYNTMQTVVIESGVTTVGKCAFFRCSSLTGVTIPDSVTSIGESAFNYCASLANVNLPDSVSLIGSYAFSSCSSLYNITIPDNAAVSPGAFYGTAYYKDQNNWTDDALYLGKHLLVVRSSFAGECAILEGTCNIASRAFEQRTNLTNVVFPDSLIRIGFGAFRRCTGLTSVTIPESVTAIGGWTFHNCANLASVTFNAVNCAAMGSAAYPVFEGCAALKTVIVGDRVTTLPSYAFYQCASLKSVRIPDGVTSIGYNAFKDCESLTDVYYSGTKEQWDAITVKGGNDVLSNANFHGEHKHAYTSAVTTDPTCTEDGIRTYSCECGDTYTEPVDKLPHTYDNVVVTPPTCTAQGYTTYTCSRCGDSYVDDYTDALGHDYAAAVTAPTCTAQGYTTHTCSRCGDSYVDDYTDALGHTEGDWVVTKQPTATEDGVRTLFCVECGETLRARPIAHCSVTLGDVSLISKASVALRPQITADADVKYTVRYSSSDPNVAKVNEATGEVTGAKKGTAAVTCTVTDEFGNTVSAACNVTVNYTAWQWIIMILLFGWLWY